MRSKKALGLAAAFLLISGAMAYLVSSSDSPSSSVVMERIPASAEKSPEVEAVSKAPVQNVIGTESSEIIKQKTPEKESLPRESAQAPVSRTEQEPAGKKLATLPPVKNENLPSPEVASGQPNPMEEEVHSEPVPVRPTVSAGVNPLVGLRLFFGLGMNYVQYDEQLSDLTTKYRDFRGPSSAVGLVMDLTSMTSVGVSYKSTPMKFDNSSVSMSPMTGNWQTLIFQMATALGGKSPGQSGFQALLGAQVHQMPMALFENTTNIPVMRDILLANASMGIAHEKYFDPNTRSEIYLRAQYPISSQSLASGSDLSIQPVVMFDGSVGAEKQIKPGYWMGVHWYGQYQKMKFKYEDSTTTASGTHTVLFSNAELRLTIEF